VRRASAGAERPEAGKKISAEKKTHHQDEIYQRRIYDRISDTVQPGCFD
jgi:hypothetical protein